MLLFRCVCACVWYGFLCGKIGWLKGHSNTHHPTEQLSLSVSWIWRDVINTKISGHMNFEANLFPFVFPYFILVDQCINFIIIILRNESESTWMVQLLETDFCVEVMRKKCSWMDRMIRIKSSISFCNDFPCIETKVSFHFEKWEFSARRVSYRNGIQSFKIEFKWFNLHLNAWRDWNAVIDFPFVRKHLNIGTSLIWAVSTNRHTCADIVSMYAPSEHIVTTE